METIDVLCLFGVIVIGVLAIAFEILYFKERLRRKEAEALYEFEAEYSRAVIWNLKKHIIELQADKSRLELEIQGMLAEIDALAEKKYQEFKKELEERDGDV